MNGCGQGKVLPDATVGGNCSGQVEKTKKKQYSGKTKVILLDINEDYIDHEWHTRCKLEYEFNPKLSSAYERERGESSASWSDPCFYSFPWHVRQLHQIWGVCLSCEVQAQVVSVILRRIMESYIGHVVAAWTRAIRLVIRCSYLQVGFSDQTNKLGQGLRERLSYILALFKSRRNNI